MNPRLIEIALRKQALQIRAERQRDALMAHLEGFESALDVVDEFRDGAHWARHHAPLLSGAVLILLASRPRQTFRLAKRASIAWLLYRRLRGESSANAGLMAIALVRRAASQLVRAAKAGRAR
ncbi:YqjK-like family protein [Azoarcus sp. L1K30]|uniref:YqjK-like family protein n=1 Tax=Azoarcus sp. L1K30 TaxID=2820277 RepID=UPI001B82CCE2|nr:YqjK-like family protein [Azoarcus sp. L1K30]MBR0566477.1 YqjK-like family protein [Azoarcus sp. L1K30]